MISESPKRPVSHALLHSPIRGPLSRVPQTSPHFLPHHRLPNLLPWLPQTSPIICLPQTPSHLPQTDPEYSFSSLMPALSCFPETAPVSLLHSRQIGSPIPSRLQTAAGSPGSRPPAARALRRPAPRPVSGSQAALPRWPRDPVCSGKTLVSGQQAPPAPGRPAASPAAPRPRLRAEAGRAHRAAAFASGGPQGAETRGGGNAEVEIQGPGARKPREIRGD